jgi:hypothetical protein
VPHLAGLHSHTPTKSAPTQPWVHCEELSRGCEGRDCEDRRLFVLVVDFETSVNPHAQSISRRTQPPKLVIACLSVLNQDLVVSNGVRWVLVEGWGRIGP